MADAIVVLNAGSSSIKFAVFVDRRGELELDVGGQIEGLYTAPRFVARDRSGEVEAEASWEDRATFGHDGALDYLVPFLRRRLANDHLVGVGHRVVHGGVEYTQPVRVESAILVALE